MNPREPFDFPHPFFAPWRDDPNLSPSENHIAYWAVHDHYFSKSVADLPLLRRIRGFVVPEASDSLIASLMKIMPPLPGREAEYREWAAITNGRKCMEWDRVRKGWED